MRPQYYVCDNCHERMPFGRYKLVRWHGRYHSLFLCEECYDTENVQKRMDALWEAASLISSPVHEGYGRPKTMPPGTEPPSGGAGSISEFSIEDVLIAIRVLDTYLTSLECYVDAIDDRLSKLEEKSGPPKPAASRVPPVPSRAEVAGGSERGQSGPPKLAAASVESSAGDGYPQPQSSGSGRGQPGMEPGVDGSLPPFPPERILGEGEVRLQPGKEPGVDEVVRTFNVLPLRPQPGAGGAPEPQAPSGDKQHERVPSPDEAPPGWDTPPPANPRKREVGE